VSEIQTAGQRAANLTSQLLAFSRKQILQPQTLELNTVVSNVCQMLRRLLGEDIQIALHLDGALGQIQADQTQLEQVLVNMAVNARDAMPQGGQLVIETHNIEVSRELALAPGIPPGHYVVLVVTDTGCGMDEATTRFLKPCPYGSAVVQPCPPFSRQVLVHDNRGYRKPGFRVGVRRAPGRKIDVGQDSNGNRPQAISTLSEAASIANALTAGHVPGPLAPRGSNPALGASYRDMQPAEATRPREPLEVGRISLSSETEQQ
jgi:hypothetical protein